MITKIKWILITLLIVLALIVAGVMTTLSASLPELDGEITSDKLEHFVTLSRDSLGQAVITADSRADAVYALGYAHGQDRFFQMDAQRRLAAGELSEWLGDGLLSVDKTNRFHQLRKRSQQMLAAMPQWQHRILDQYTAGVNDGLSGLSVVPFEYIVTNFSPIPWRKEDSVLVALSMYLDLQSREIEHDLVMTHVKETLGQDWLAFVTQASEYQAALDDSRLTNQSPIPAPIDTAALGLTSRQLTFTEPMPIGSNNWSVTGDLTSSGSAMLSDDMHLGIRVPVIWYRAQLNYQRNNQAVQMTGVSLPGLPGIVVGTNGHFAWGFTNAYIDSVDWVELSPTTPTFTVTEEIKLKDETRPFTIVMSEFGPVREIGDKRYALQWVGYQDYAVDLDIMNLDLVTTINDAIPIANNMGIPVQNFTMADSQGNAGWTLGGAVSAREQPSVAAISEDQVSQLWRQQESSIPQVVNPESGRIWTANTRVMSARDHQRFGDGGYALGARSMQIRDRLLEKAQLDEADFYAIQLDNEARFLSRWHKLLTELLQTQPDVFAQDLAMLSNWGQCACEDSVGYTLVKAFRLQVMRSIFSPVAQILDDVDLSISSMLNHVETGTWQLVTQQPSNWLSPQHPSWNTRLLDDYRVARQELLAKHAPNNQLSELNWGKVNAFAIKHPVGDQLPLVSSWFNMPVYAGFGDTNMPAVQGPQFGASQRLIVQPGQLESAILTLPGGQSGHPMSAFYHAGFAQYAQGDNTPLLPGDIVHTLTMRPSAQHQ